MEVWNSIPGHLGYSIRLQEPRNDPLSALLTKTVMHVLYAGALFSKLMKLHMFSFERQSHWLEL